MIGYRPLQQTLVRWKTWWVEKGKQTQETIKRMFNKKNGEKERLQGGKGSQLSLDKVLQRATWTEGQPCPMSTLYSRLCTLRYTGKQAGPGPWLPRSQSHSYLHRVCLQDLKLKAISQPCVPRVLTALEWYLPYTSRLSSYEQCSLRGTSRARPVTKTDIRAGWGQAHLPFLTARH